jgi:hypothetical protein
VPVWLTSHLGLYILKFAHASGLVSWVSKFPLVYHLSNSLHLYSILTHLSLILCWFALLVIARFPVMINCVESNPVAQFRYLDAFTSHLSTIGTLPPLALGRSPHISIC